MSFGNKIAQYRKQLGLTQEALAIQLGVTNQAVSKWESDVCYPDIALLPKLADIYGVSLDVLFGREAPQYCGHNLPWADDGVVRGVVYQGHRLMGRTATAGTKITFRGDVAGVQCDFTLECGEVHGSVAAAGNVTCAAVDGDIDAGGDVSCNDVSGDVDAGCNVTCGNVFGNVDVGCNVTCGNVSGNIDAGCNVQCQSVEGNVDAGCGVIIQK